MPSVQESKTKDLICAGLFTLFEFLNFMTHRVLKDLRKPGTTERGIPKRRTKNVHQILRHTIVLGTKQKQMHAHGESNNAEFINTECNHHENNNKTTDHFEPLFIFRRFIEYARTKNCRDKTKV